MGRSRRRRATEQPERARPASTESGRDPEGAAGDLLDRLMSWSTATTSQTSFSRLLGRELAGVPAEVLTGLDAIVSARLLGGVGRLWEQGWQPRDLLHVLTRLDRWATALGADAAVEEVRRSPRAQLAPPAWRDQLDAAGEVARSADLGRWSTDTKWRAVDRLVAAGVPSLTAWASHWALTSDSRPEKPPSPATLAPDWMIDSAAPCWLETPMVPPPWLSA
jgi:hypothetical protein